jgi:hypothetical protein
VQVHYSEGVAIHIGPEPCVVVRKGAIEASAGERIGQPLSRERNFTSSSRRPRVSGRQQGRYAKASVCSARRGRRPWHVRKLFVREPGDPKSGRYALAVRVGKARSRSR